MKTVFKVVLWTVVGSVVIALIWFFGPDPKHPNEEQSRLDRAHVQEIRDSIRIDPRDVPTAADIEEGIVAQILENEDMDRHYDPYWR